MVTEKGKEKVTDSKGKGKRKFSGGGDDDKTGRKRKNRGVLQFFEDAAYQVDEDEDSSDDSIFDDDDFLEDEFGSELKDNAPGKVPQLPFIPKEEEMSEEEFERMLGERYKPGSGFVTYAEDGYEHKKFIDSDIYVPSAKDPRIWKVKCMVGRERYSAFCLMQKFVDLENLGTKLQIISACSLDHVKGYIFIEAEKQNTIYEACKGLSTIYSSRVAPVPNNEISRLLLVRSKSGGISKGMWARVKNGTYKGDLALVEAVNHVRKKVTVKLIPRIDLKALAEKLGGGVRAKRNVTPAQRLISSSELDEFRAVIQVRRDRETNQMVEVLDGMMLKDGYLYKKIAIDSLSFWGVTPTEDELLKFEPSNKNESTDVQWISQLFGEKKKKQIQIAKQDKGGGKGEGSSSTSVGNNFELHDLVFFGRKDFGVVIGSEKDDSVKVIKEGSEGPSVVTVKQSELKGAYFDKKLFSVLDQQKNTLSVNDSVRVLEGPLKDRQGIVKKIYKGILFLCDESEQENSGYICVKAQLCEKLNLSNASNEKGVEPGPSGFADLSSSPKSPLSPDRSWQEKENKSSYKRDDNGMFSVGQSLRIRVGPLKGYLCRVLAIRRSDVTVKLDSQQKILTVKSEHLSEVRGRNSAAAQGDEAGSAKPFDFLGSQDDATGWMDSTALPTEGDAWNAAGSTERSSWSAFPSSNFSLSKESGSGEPVDDDAKKGESSWEIKATPSENSSWGAAAAMAKITSEVGTVDGWGKPAEPQEDKSGQKQKDDSWGRAAEKWTTSDGASGSKAAWGQPTDKAGGDLDQPETSAWKKDSFGGEDGTTQGQTDGWNKPKSVGADSGVEASWGKPQGTSSWNKQDGGSSWGKSAGESSWGQQADANAEGKQKGWNSQSKPSENKQDGNSSWGKSEGTSSWNKQDGGSSWNKSAGKSWGQQSDQNGQSNTDGAGGDQGFGGWGRSKPFDSGRGSGGRRGGRGRGGRDQYGRGRSFDQGQSAGWNKEGQFGGSSDAGRKSSWSSDNAGGWGSDAGQKSSWSSANAAGGWGTDAGKKSSGNSDNAGGWGNDTEKNSTGNNDNAGGWGSDAGIKASEDSNKAGGWGSDASKKLSGDSDNAGGWGSDAGKKSTDSCDNAGGWDKAIASGKDEEPAWNRGSAANGWNNSNASNNSNSSGWGGSGNANKEAGNGQDSWGSTIKSSDDNHSSGWGKTSNWGSQSSGGNGNDWKGSSWNPEKNVSGGSSSGWGQSSNWSKSGTNESGENSGRGGGWRGGRGGRGDRGGFRGRGGSDRGGFGGRGRGGFGGRSGDGEGFRGGRGGGFRGGRGRGDWNNRGDDGGNSWNKGSNSSSGGWQSSGNGGSQGWSSSWSQAKGDASSSWNSANKDSGKNETGGSGGWGSSNAATQVSTGWNSANNDSGKNETGGSGGWGSSNAVTQVSTGRGTGEKTAAESSWGASDRGQSSGPTKEGGASEAWGKAVSSSWEAATENRDVGGSWKADVNDGQNSGMNKDEGASDAWGKAAGSSWGGEGDKKGGW